VIELIQIKTVLNLLKTLYFLTSQFNPPFLAFQPFQNLQLPPPPRQAYVPDIARPIEAMAAALTQ